MCSVTHVRPYLTTQVLAVNNSVISSDFARNAVSLSLAKVLQVIHYDTLLTHKDDSIDLWREGRAFLDFPSPNRIVFAGKPGCGKSFLGHHCLQATLKSILHSMQADRAPGHRPDLFRDDDRSTDRAIRGPIYRS